MQLLFASTLLVSAGLLFLVQPMFAKMVLPRLGGTPAVWNTCMVFYQAVLLAGYLYAHLATRWLGTRRQAMVHLGLLLLPWLVLPIGMVSNWTPPSGENPIPWLLLLMSISVGLPFFVVSTSAPMLQAWFADTGHPSARDPYFLYAASNLGSMAALLGYPLVVEPYLTLAGQTFWWAVGYAGLMGLTLACAVVLWRSSGRGALAVATIGDAAVNVEGDIPTAVALEEKADVGTTPTLGLRMRWLALSFAPSSLLLGVTTFISTDVAAFPLLWVIPLALYLLTFVLVFARWTILPHRLMVFLQPFLVVIMAMLFFRTSASWMQWLVLLHLAAFFVTTMVCHGELAHSRPKASHLTEFYIWMSAGGVLGGLFNALVAPLAFRQVWEYPLVVAFACMLRPKPAPAKRPVLARWFDVLLPMLLLFALQGLYTINFHRSGLNKLPAWFGGQPWDFTWNWLNWLAGLNLVLEWLHQHLLWVNQIPAWFGGNPWQLLGTSEWRMGSETAILGLGALAAFALQARPVRFGLAVGMLLVAKLMLFETGSGTIYEDRSFFGVVRVRESVTDLEDGGKRIEHTLVHGSTNHGAQWADLTPEQAEETTDTRRLWQIAEKGRIPITYYYRTGPVGQVFTRLTDPKKTREIGVIGLGTGTTAAWGKPGQHITYFEIDPMVKRISVDSDKLFSWVTDAKANGVDVTVRIDDARISLEDDAIVPPGTLDLLIVDAFSSDAIPIHLLTKEAVELYFRKLTAEGILLVHISNRHLNLAPVVGNLARELGLVSRLCNDYASDEDAADGKFSSEWVVVVRNEKRLGSLATNSNWKPIPRDRRVGIWTDDFSNIMAVLKWFRSSEPGDDDEEE